MSHPWPKSWHHHRGSGHYAGEALRVFETSKANAELVLAQQLLDWLQGRPVVALTADTAAIENPETGSITTYRRFDKPALGPLGDSLDDL